MLGKYLKINNEAIPNPNPGTWNETYTPQENIFTTEAGSQLSSVVRLNRMTWTAEFNCTSSMKEKLLTLAQSASVTCKFDNGTAKSGRLRVNGDINLFENSEYVDRTKGLWVVPLIFEEF